MARYSCTQCGAEVGRDNLTVRRVVFTTMGVGFKTLKSRTTDWLCEECRDQDPTWKADANYSAPGAVEYRDTQEQRYPTWRRLNSKKWESAEGEQTDEGWVPDFVATRGRAGWRLKTRFTAKATGGFKSISEVRQYVDTISKERVS